MSVPSVLYGNTWVGDITPTTPVWVGQQWVQPTAGTIGYWTGTAWTFFGNINNVMGGAVQAAGDTVTGPILNIPNYLPQTNANALGTFTLNGYPVALQTDLTNLQNTMTSLITNQVRAQFLSQYQQSSVAANICGYQTMTTMTVPGIMSGSSYTGLAITLPSFSDGVQAVASQLVDYGWSVVGFGGLTTASSIEITEISSASDMKAGIFTPTVGSKLLGGNWAGTIPTNNFQILTWATAAR